MDMSVKLNLSYPAVLPASSNSTTVVDKTAAAPQADKVQAAPDTDATNKDADSSERLKRAVQDIEKFVQSIKRNLEFSIDEHSGKVIVKVIASETGEVVRQIPSAEAMKLADSLSSASSLLFDGKA
ncbi:MULTISPECIES: flagellar protein FlaG [Pseudomonas]|uniref:Flagellar protein FlaG n=1 Tax=Pseudomonas asplenii TaxID=53407 RepID=A0A0M9GDU4_9PSED|nr:flagellar protein FlaG [Pseudomonas fuscovaginae]KPA88677.1 flagellar protein FlaG [Pseudomonas fuscovaginae]KPA94651.1 flagellar protein FlaG [Pseudomonas fuscovaginae]